MKKLPTDSRTHRTAKWLCGGAVLAACLLLCLAGFRIFAQPKAEYQPPSFAENIADGVPPLSASDGYGTVSTDFGFSFALCAAPEYDGNQLFLYLTNPDTNDTWLMAEILNEDGTKSFGKSGIVKEGSYISSFPMDMPLPEDEPFSVRIYAFTPDTYQSEGTVDLGGLNYSDTVTGS